jgi:hypothetical protein
MTAECGVVHPQATHTDGDAIRCTLPKGHTGNHEDHSNEENGEVLIWAGHIGEAP